MGTGFGCLGMIIFGLILLKLINIDDVGGGLILLCMFGIVASGVIGIMFDDKRKFWLADDLVKKIKNIMKSIENFKITQEFFSPNLESYIAIDEENKQICIIENEHKNYSILSETLNKYEYKSYVLDYKDIIQSEILRDGVTINKTSRGSQIGGALVGGVLAGGVGAVIGGLSASSESTSTVTKLELQVVVNNSKKSFHRVIFMSPDDITLPERILPNKDLEKEITHWYNLLSHIVDKTEPELSTTNLMSTADELNKLLVLRNSGVLTDEEFNQQKSRILSY